jgi:hypothetical protein
MRRVLAVVAAVLVAVAGPAGSAIADSGLPLYRTAGTPVKGTARSTDAPLIKPGTYTDTIGVGEKKFYGVDLDDASSAFVSAVAAPEPGTQVGYADGITVSLQDTNGNSCSLDGRASFGSAEAARPVADYATRRIIKDGQCQTADHYLFVVERDSAATSDPGAWTTELRFMLEPGVTTTATTAASAGSWSSATPAPPTGAGKSVIGGTGFTDAATLGTGVYKDEVEPGETLFYQVRVGWGQQLFATAELGNAKVTGNGGFAGSGVQMDLYNTARGSVDNNSVSYSGEQASVALGTAPARYTNRFDSTSAVSAMRFSGWYYLEITLSPAVRDFVDGKVGVTLRINVKGEAGAGPTYVSDPGKAGFGVGAASSDASGGTGGFSGSALRFAGFAALGAGTVLVLSLGVWTIAARRQPAGSAG